MKKLFLQVFMLLLVATSSLHAESESVPHDYQTTVLLPINWFNKDKINLQVTIPEGFQADKSIAQFEKSNIIAFYPTDENAINYSEAIILSKMLGKKIKAHQFIKEFKRIVKNDHINVTVWNQTNHTVAANAIQIAFLGLSFDYNNEREVIGALFVSGPYDCVGYIYAVRTSEQLSEEDAIVKIGEFLINNVNIPSV